MVSDSLRCFQLNANVSQLIAISKMMLRSHIAKTWNPPFSAVLIGKIRFYIFAWAFESFLAVEIEKRVCF